MKFRAPAFLLPLCLLAASCMNEPGDGGKKPTVIKPSAGAFQVSLREPTDFSGAATSVEGQVFDGPSPSALAWKETGQSGGCTLLEPNAPFCSTPCGSEGLCVENNKCQAYAKPVGVGQVTVQGIKTKAGTAAFVMTPINLFYQPASGDSLSFPPFAEGDLVTFSASGDTTVPAFKVVAQGITRLQVKGDSLVLADGKPIVLEWTAPANPGKSGISVLVDISHHGGTRGKIECETDDDGSLEIAASLVDKLKALGVSGFPKVEVARKAIATNSDVHVDLVLESRIVKSLHIPGLISCDHIDDCPLGQTCQQDMQCK